MAKKAEGMVQDGARLGLWQGRMARCRMAYEGELALMRERDAIYNGTARVDAAPGGAGRLGAARRRARFTTRPTS